MRSSTVAPHPFLIAVVLAAAFAPASRAAADETRAQPAPAASAVPAPALPAPAAASAAVTSGVAAGTRIRFHVDAPLSSASSKTGDTFTFALLDPVRTTGERVIPAGAKGSGTLLLAGHAGSGGHEGDLTLRLDTIDLADGTLRFDNQRFEVNGRNRKAASSILGFIPIIGYGAMFMRGSDVRIDPATPLETVLERGALLETK